MCFHVLHVMEVVVVKVEVVVLGAVWLLVVVMFFAVHGSRT